MDTRTIKRIQRLIEKGYQIKLPGGTSRDGNHSSFASLLKKKRYNAIEGVYEYSIVVIPYIPLPKGEKRKVDPRERVYAETPEQTLEREILEETGISLAKAIYTEAGINEFDDNREGHEGQKHRQAHFLCTYFDDSNMRDTFSLTEKNIGIPFVVDLDDDLEKYIASNHRWMIRAVRDRIGQKPDQNLNLKNLHAIKRAQPVY